jgi:hypothetical protein
MTRVWRAIDAYFFSPTSGFDLAVARVLFFAFLIARDGPRDFAIFADVDPAFWNPVGPLSFGLFPVLPHGAIVVAHALFVGACALCAMGFFFRAASWVAFFTGTWLIDWAHSFQKLDLMEICVPFALLTFALSHAGDVMSLDRQRAAKRGDAAPGPSGEYRWPIRAMWILLALIFFGAGTAKLRHCGLAWVDGHAMSNLLMMHSYDVGLNYGPLTPLGTFIAPHSWMCLAMAASTVVFEVSFPIALFWPPSRRVLFPVSILFMFLAVTMMVPTIVNVLACQVFLVPWERVVRRSGRG